MAASPRGGTNTWSDRDLPVGPAGGQGPVPPVVDLFDTGLRPSPNAEAPESGLWSGPPGLATIRNDGSCRVGRLRAGTISSSWDRSRRGVRSRRAPALKLLKRCD